MHDVRSVRSATTAGAVALAALAWVSAPRDAEAREDGILEVHTDLAISPDATVQADQTILIWVNGGARIKHGITWELPARYRQRPDGIERGAERRAALEVLRVTRDGRPEPFAAAETAGGARLRLEIGAPAVALEPGTHVYVVSYRARGQIDFGGDRDAIVAPVIAGGHELVINQAAIVLHLPEEVTQAVDTLTGFVIGADGATAQTIAGDRRGAGAVVTITRALGPGDGLAITGSWPKGFVRGPTTDEQVSYFLRDNRPFVFAGVVLLMEALFLLGVSGLLERGHAPGLDRGAAAKADAPDAPPDGLSAAALRFALRGRADATALAAALLELQATDVVGITRGADGLFVVSRSDAAPPISDPLPRPRGSLLTALFTDGDSLRIDERAAAVLTAARRALRDGLAASVGQRYGARAPGHAMPALAFTLAGAIALAAGTPAADGRVATAALAAVAGLCTVLAAGALAAATRPNARRALTQLAVTLATLAIDVLLLRALAARATPIGAFTLAAIGVAGYRLARPARVTTAAGRVLAERAAAFRRLIAGRRAAGDGTGSAARLLQSYAIALDAPASEEAAAFSTAVRSASIG